jgi:hypothetical protein
MYEFYMHQMLGRPHHVGRCGRFGRWRESGRDGRERVEHDGEMQDMNEVYMSRCGSIGV